MTTVEEFAADAQEDYKAVGCVSYLTVGKYLETILEHFDMRCRITCRRRR